MYFLCGFFLSLSFRFMQKSLYLFCMTKCNTIASLQGIGNAFSVGKWVVCSTTLTEHQPLKRGGQISQHLLVHPNLQFIIVPHPCRKRSVTLEDCPATHLSSFTLLPSYPFYARFPLVSDAEEMHVFYNCLLHFAFPSSPPQRKRKEKKAIC